MAEASIPGVRGFERGTLGLPGTTIQSCQRPVLVTIRSAYKNAPLVHPTLPQSLLFQTTTAHSLSPKASLAL